MATRLIALSLCICQIWDQFYVSRCTVLCVAGNFLELIFVSQESKMFYVFFIFFWNTWNKVEAVCYLTKQKITGYLHLYSLYISVLSSLFHAGHLCCVLLTPFHFHFCLLALYCFCASGLFANCMVCWCFVLFQQCWTWCMSLCSQGTCCFSFPQLLSLTVLYL